MTTPLVDEESQAMIQNFTVWAQSKGLHIVGALVGPKGTNNVRIFASAPEGTTEDQAKHARKLLEIAIISMDRGKSTGTLHLPINSN